MKNTVKGETWREKKNQTPEVIEQKSHLHSQGLYAGLGQNFHGSPWI